MSTSVELSFVKNFEAEVHLQYQQMGSKLRNTVRTKNNVVGATTTFQKVGKGTASTKARHGKVPVMNVDHTPIECTLQTTMPAIESTSWMNSRPISMNNRSSRRPARSLSAARPTS
jgi:capsid protein